MAFKANCSVYFVVDLIPLKSTGRTVFKWDNEVIPHLADQCVILKASSVQFNLSVVGSSEESDYGV